MRQYDLESKALTSGRQRLSKSGKQETARKQSADEDTRRTMLRLRSITLELEREVANLEMSIHSEMELARVGGDSVHLDSAEKMRSRHANLKATIAVLAARLARSGLTDQDRGSACAARLQSAISK